MEMDHSSPNPWGLIAAATFIFIILILALIFTSNESNRSASTDLSSRGTTSAELRTAPPAISVPPDRSASTSGARQ
jgi:hypothetical protein